MMSLTVSEELVRSFNVVAQAVTILASSQIIHK